MKINRRGFFGLAAKTAIVAPALPAIAEQMTKGTIKASDSGRLYFNTTVSNSNGGESLTAAVYLNYSDTITGKYHRVRLGKE